MFCYLVNENVATIATALDFSVILHFIFKNNCNAFTLVPNIRINHHYYHHTSVYNSNLVFVMILHQKVINGKELREITQRTWIFIELSCMTLNVISNVPDKKVIDPKPASRQGELDTPPMIKFARGRSVFFSRHTTVLYQ